MRSRCLLLAAMLSVCACDKKGETVLVPPSSYQQPNPANRGGGVVAMDQPAEGMIAGKRFVPDNVVFEGRTLSFRKGKDIFPEMEIKFDVPDGKLEGMEWKFEGDKLENPIILASVTQSSPVSIWPKDYTLTLKNMSETSTNIEGKIDLHARDNTQLIGRFTATRKKTKTASDPLEADDAPFVRGNITVVGSPKEENLPVGFAAGFIGKGVDGNPHSNMTRMILDPKGPGGLATSLTFRPQLTSIASDNKGTLTYRHTRVPPGEYLVYVKRNTVPAAWQKITLKAGDQLTVDLTIDPAKGGEVVVTLPDEEANDKSDWSLALYPISFGKSGSEYPFAFTAADVKSGQKTTKVARVPAGKYLAVRGNSHAEVEVVAGKSTAVTLVRNVPSKK
jgi:hypothetical protein